MQCHNCGATLRPGARFCNICGAPLIAVDQLPTAPAPWPAGIDQLPTATPVRPGAGPQAALAPTET